MTADRGLDCRHHWLPRELVEDLGRYIADGLRVAEHAGQWTVHDRTGAELLAVDTSMSARQGAWTS
jgi:hypothetical protein